MKFAYRHYTTAASIVLLLLLGTLLSFSMVEATTTVDNNHFVLARRSRREALAPTTRKPALARMIRRGGASLPPQPKPSLTLRDPVVSLEGAANKEEESTVVESDLTVVLDDNDVDTTATNKARILQAVTFLFVFSFSIVALAPAPALISNLGAEKATTLLSIITGCGALTEILFSSRLGALLDSKGRKPAFILTMMLIATINAAVAMQGSVPALCLSKFFSILAISVFALSSQAVMSDLSETVANPEQWLSSTIGANMAASGVGFLSGVIAAGLLSDQGGGGLVTVFAASATVAAASGLLSTLFLPETLPTRKRAAATAAATTTSSLPAMTSARQRLRQLLEVPLSSTKLLFRHGPKVRILAILLMLLNLPMYQGDMFQVYSKQEWNLDTKSLSSYLALYGFVGIFANGCGSFLIQRIGTKRFTMLAILSRIISTTGAAFFGYKGAVVGIMIGFLGAAQTIGIIAALVSAGTKSGLPQGELAGQRSSLLALLKVVGPFLYSFLYIQGSGVLAMPNLPFIFNIVVSLVALIATQLYLS